MVRAERFTVGMALISFAVAILLKTEFVAYPVLALGSLLVFGPALASLIWGKDRPTRPEIERMSADEYGKRMRDPKFERWVNHVNSKRYGVLWKFVPISVVVIVTLAVFVWRKEAPVKQASTEQWVLERYSADKGYTFAKNGIRYQAKCWATELQSVGPDSRILMKGADVCEPVMLPYVRKAVPLQQPSVRSMTESPEMLYFREEATGLRYIFQIVEAN